MLNYSNPTGRCQGCPQDLSNNVSIVRSCCDAGSMFTGPCDDFRGCDSYFIYCLRPLNSTAEGGCTKFENQTSTANMEDGPIDFSQSTVLGLANPLLLQGLTDAYTVSLAYIEMCKISILSLPAKLITK